MENLSLSMRLELSLKLSEEERKAVYQILKECNDDFVPPLSKRSTTFQTDWTNTQDSEEGIKSYFDEIIRQNNVLLKKDGKVIAFLSFKVPYTCEALEAYQPLCYLTTLCMDKRYRGFKLTPAIYEYTQECIHRLYPEYSIGLRTWSTNKAQLHMMEQMGFSCVACLKNDRGEGIDTVYFVKKESLS